MTLNANGIRAAVRRGLWDFVAEHRPDVVCLQEVRAHRVDLPPLPAGYAAHWHLAERKGYSGVGLHARALAHLVPREPTLSDHAPVLVDYGG